MSSKITLAETNTMCVYYEYFDEEEVYLSFSMPEEFYITKTSINNLITIKIKKEKFLEFHNNIQKNLNNFK
tara:strand:- start:1506 stop:1718 length:213 start_codon:yes stop_codon:yes gene_type:complete